MVIKPYWVLVAGFVMILLYVVALRVRSRRSYSLPGIEGFADASVFTMFGVDWCPHCVKAKPLFESLGPTATIGANTVSLRYVNPEKDKAAAEGFEIDGYPTFYLEHNGQKTKYTGPRSADGFLQFLQKSL
jgi:thioredoxin-like negative regulator of GroEL